MASKLIVNEIEHTDGSGTAVTMAKATIADATLTGGAISGGSIGSAVTGTLGSGVTGGSGLTAMAANPSLNLGSNTTFPAGHVVAYKHAILAVTGSVYASTSSQTWVGTHANLNITHAMENQNNYLIFTVSSGQLYVPVGVNYYYVGIGKTTDLTGNDANIIRYGGDHAAGRHHSVKAYNTELTGITTVMRYYPSTTDSITYQPIQRCSSASLGYLTNNSDATNCIFTLTEVKV
jgi:hypothetical protein